MKAIFKSKLVTKFDKAIKDAEDSDCEIMCFELESLEENRALRRYVALCGLATGEPFDYQGIPIVEFEPTTEP